MDELKHGSYSTYVNKKCRCDECREAAREYQRTKRGTQPDGDGVYRRGRKEKALEHGTYTGYQKGCRCEQCRAALSEYSRSRRVGLEPGDPRHGTSNGYTNLGCRCDLCRAAVTEARRSKEPLADDDSRHGTMGGYFNYRCRCDECRKAATDYSRESGNGRKGALKANYGLTPEQWDEMFESQGGVCASCGEAPKPDAKRRFHVDHNHTTGAVRGILCHSCNVGLGHLKEDRQRILALVAYLDRWEPVSPSDGLDLF